MDFDNITSQNEQSDSEQDELQKQNEPVGADLNVQNNVQNEDRAESCEECGKQQTDAERDAQQSEEQNRNDAPQIGEEPKAAGYRYEYHAAQDGQYERSGQHGRYYEGFYNNNMYTPPRAAGYDEQGIESCRKMAEKKGHKTAIIICGLIIAVSLLFGGAMAGSFAYSYYTAGRNEQSTAESELPENSVKLEISKIEPSKDAQIQSGQELTVEQIAEKVTPSVVGVLTESYSDFSGSGTGSGIIMSADGYIITNYHVVSGSDRITVVLDNGDDYSAKEIGYDAQTDIAVLKIDAKDLPVAEFGDSDALKQGSLAVAIGNPLGMQLQGTVTQGCISAINRNVVVDHKVMTLIQTDASINPGNSGGPLVNKYGQVVGINSVKLGISYYEGLGFAIPMNTVKPIVDELIAYGYVKGRPALGITGRNITERASNFYGVPQGVLVDEVESGSDAAKKGVKSGDIITAVNGQRVYEMQDISEIKSEFKAGDEITVTVYRDGKSSDIKFMLMDEAALSGAASD